MTFILSRRGESRTHILGNCLCRLIWLPFKAAVSMARCSSYLFFSSGLDGLSHTLQRKLWTSCWSSIGVTVHLHCMYPLKEIPLLLSCPGCTILYKSRLQKELDVIKCEVDIKIWDVFSLNVKCFTCCKLHPGIKKKLYLAVP